MPHMHNGRSGCRGPSQRPALAGHMQQAVAQRQQSSRPSLSTIAQRGTSCLLLRYAVLHANLAYLSCSTPDCSQLHSVRRALAGHIGTLAPHGLIELMRLVWGVRLIWLTCLICLR